MEMEEDGKSGACYGWAGGRVVVVGGGGWGRERVIAGSGDGWWARELLGGVVVGGDWLLRIGWWINEELRRSRSRSRAAD